MVCPNKRFNAINERISTKSKASENQWFVIIFMGAAEFAIRTPISNRQLIKTNG
jgi:hypothetical protein